MRTCYVHVRVPLPLCLQRIRKRIWGKGEKVELQNHLHATGYFNLAIRCRYCWKYLWLAIDMLLISRHPSTLNVMTSSPWPENYFSMSICVWNTNTEKFLVLGADIRTGIRWELFLFHFERSCEFGWGSLQDWAWFSNIVELKFRYCIVFHFEIFFICTYQLALASFYLQLVDFGCILR